MTSGSAVMIAFGGINVACVFVMLIVSLLIELLETSVCCSNLISFVSSLWSVPLSAVHEVMNRERKSYDRILLMLSQRTEDVKEKEDDLLSLRNKLEAVVNESKEKDRVQANDFKLIMQLSKKLENLLMENKNLRDQNDRLKTRLVSIEADIMNRSGRS